MHILTEEVPRPNVCPVPYVNITATSPANSSEPRTAWRQAESRYVTTDIRRQLGATAQKFDHSERGVLTLDRDSLFSAIEEEVKPQNLDFAPGYDNFAGNLAGMPGFFFVSQALAFCGDCIGDAKGTVSLWDQLFVDTLEDTGSPALAIQAVHTAAARMSYSRWLSAFSKEGQANLTTFITVRASTRAVGYSVVMAIIGVQGVLLVIATVMFRACENTALNSAWLVTAQVSQSPGAAGILTRASTMTDADVVRHMRGEKKGRWLRRREKCPEFIVRQGIFQPKDKDLAVRIDPKQDWI